MPTNLALLSSRTIGLYAERKAQGEAAAPSERTDGASGAGGAERATARSALADQLVDMFAAVRANKRVARAEARIEKAAQHEGKVTAAMSLFIAERARRAG